MKSLSVKKAKLKSSTYAALYGNSFTFKKYAGATIRKFITLAMVNNPTTKLDNI
jgi:hypothetical protein